MEDRIDILIWVFCKSGHVKQKNQVVRVKQMEKISQTNAITLTLTNSQSLDFNPRYKEYISQEIEKSTKKHLNIENFEATYIDIQEI